MIVIKKNQAVFRNCWIGSTQNSTLERCPTLIIDDEADQRDKHSPSIESRESTGSCGIAATIGSVRRIHGAIRDLFIDPQVEDDL